MPSGTGEPRTRLEDERFLTGAGKFCDDIHADGAAWAVFVRSPFAHAEIIALSTEKAEQSAGVLGVFGASDLTEDGLGHIPCMFPVMGKDGKDTIVPPHPALADGKVRYVGEPVIMVIAETKAEAKDAAELVEIEYQDLPSVTETLQALNPDEVQIWPVAPGNVSVDWETGDFDAVADAFETAPSKVSVDLKNNRVAVNQIEPRAALGEFDPVTGKLTLTTPSQGVHVMREQLAEHVFKLPEHQIRIVTPDVGGAFGARVFCNSEQVLVLWAARQLRRPVRWTAERGECFFTDGQARDHVSQAEMAIDATGHILALRVSIVANLGAYAIHYGPIIPTEFCCDVLTGCYRIPALHASVKCVFTNTVPIDTYRGTGRAEAVHLLERLIDVAARKLGQPPDTFRRRNFIQPSELPYTTPTGLEIDSGDFPAVLERALSLSDWSQAIKRKAAARRIGLHRGIGLATYLATTGGSDEEFARLRLDENGGLTLFIGTQSSGQGHQTAYIRLLAERFGIDPGLLRVRQGDSAAEPMGGGTSFSRSLLMGGLAIEGAARELLKRLAQIAAQLLQTEESRLTFEAGVFASSDENMAISMSEISDAVAADRDLGREFRREGSCLEARYTAKDVPVTCTNGCHVCELLIDPETGKVEIENYTIVDDIGNVINPDLSAGQIHGGAAQGIGQALFEQVFYEPESGQLLSGTLMDYCLPRTDVLPVFNLQFFKHAPSSGNSMGVKGAGEAGTIAAPPAVMNAILDALKPLGVHHIEMPATCESIWQAIRQ